MALAAVAWHFFGQAGEFLAAACTGASNHEERCLCRVLMGDECLGTVLCPEPTQAHALLSAVGVRCGEFAGQRDTVPCDCTIRIDTTARHIEVDKVSGALLLAAGRRIDVNRAAAEDLEAVPGIGPKLAARIVEIRDTKGPFATVGDLRIVPGVGRKKLAQLAPFLAANPLIPVQF